MKKPYVVATHLDLCAAACFLKRDWWNENPWFSNANSAAGECISLQAAHLVLINKAAKRSICWFSAWAEAGCSFIEYDSVSSRACLLQKWSWTLWLVFHLSSPGSTLGIPAALEVLIIFPERFVNKISKNFCYWNANQPSVAVPIKQWEAVMVLGARMLQKVVVAGSGWFFDPNLMFLITLMFLMLFLSFTVKSTSSLSRSLPLPQLSALLYKDLRRLQSIWSYYTG